MERSGADKDVKDYDELVTKVGDTKLESSLLSSDLEFYLPSSKSASPRTSSDDRRQRLAVDDVATNRLVYTQLTVVLCCFLLVKAKFHYAS